MEIPHTIQELKIRKDKEFLDIVCPYMENFVKNRISWKLLNSKFKDDISLLRFFIREFIAGKKIKKIFKSELPAYFSSADVINIFFYFIYKMNIDVLTIKVIETVDNNTESRKSLWDKLSERRHV